MLKRLRHRLFTLLATLLFAQGTPMLLAGDEFGRTQHGNNNAYCQDNELSWVDWSLDDEGRELLAFCQHLIALRRSYPILRRQRFLVGHYNEELDVKDVTWLAPDGSEMTEEHWHDEEARCMGMLMDGRAQPSGVKRSGADATLLLLLNAGHQPCEFQLPEVHGGRHWLCLVDTHTAQTVPRPVPQDAVELHGRTLQLLELLR